MNSLKHLFLTTCVILSACLSLQNINAQEVVFDHTYGFTDYSAGKSIVQLKDSGYVLLANTGFAEGNSQLLFIRLDKNGIPLHFQQTTESDKLYSGGFMKIAANGDYIVTGTIRDNTNPYCPFCMRIDTAFNILWNSTFPTNDWAFGKQLAELPDGSIVVVGETYDTDSTGCDAMFLRFSKEGELLAHTFSGLQGNDGYNSVSLLDSTSLLVAGYRKNKIADDTVPFFAYIDFDGKETFLRSFEEYKSKAIVNHAIKDKKDNIVCAGETSMYDTTGHTDYFMCAFNSAGNFLDEVFVELEHWAGADDAYKSADVSEDGHIFIGATCSGNNYLQPTILIHRFDSNYVWLNSAARAGTQYDKSDVLEQLITTYDGGCIAIGTTTDLGTHLSDIFVCKMGPELSEISPVQHFLPVHEFPNEASINIFPNPTQKHLHISWDNAPQGKSKVELLDLTAHQIISYEHNFHCSPQSTISLPDLPTGVYMLKIQNDNNITTKKIVIAQ